MQFDIQVFRVPNLKNWEILFYKAVFMNVICGGMFYLHLPAKHKLNCLGNVVSRAFSSHSEDLGSIAMSSKYVLHF